MRRPGRRCRAACCVATSVASALALAPSSWRGGPSPSFALPRSGRAAVASSALPGPRCGAARGRWLRPSVAPRRATAELGLLDEDDVLVDEINELATTTTEHHSATAAAVAAAAPAAATVAAAAAARGGKRRRLQPVLTLPGDTLEQTPMMVAWVVAATICTLGAVANALVAAPTQAVLAVAGGVVMAELFSGTFHWATDNYGSLETPVVGFACAAFQGHHLAPWTISFRPFFNNVFKIAKAAVPLTALAVFFLPPAAAAFAATMFYGQLLAQEFHRWSHTPSAELAPWQKWLQRRGFAVSTAEHCRHHLPPFNAHYCILNGMLNPLLDSRPVLFWRRLEAVVYRLSATEPNCWKGEKGAKVRELAMSL